MLLDNGKVLLLGGEYIVPPAGYFGVGQLTDHSYGDIFDSQAELFHPSAATFALKYVYDHESSFAMVKLTDGKVFLAGGSSVQNGGFQHNGSNSVEVYDPLTDASTEFLGVMPDTTWSIESGYLINGDQILLSGLKVPLSEGFYPYSLLVTITHDVLGNMVIAPGTPIPNAYAYADGMSVQVSSGDIYFLGGRNSSDSSAVDSYSDVVLFQASNPSNGFTKVGSLLEPRDGAGVCRLSNNDIGIYGGYSVHGVTQGNVIRYSDVEVFNVVAKTSTPRTALLSPVGWITSVLLQGGGYTLHAGGVDATGFTASSEFVHNATANTSGSTGTMVVPRRFHNVVALNNGLVLITGGETAVSGVPGATILTSAELYDPQAKLYITFPTDQIQQATTTQFLCAGHTTDLNWTVVSEDGVSAPGTIDGNGLYTAPSNILYERVAVVTAALKDGTASASIRIRLLVPLP